ncbi:MAG: antibiotic biosynthesis monooxygenase [Flavobacterium sp.]|uniref:antibiotic biosynthesis monooxygenase family protein n=1 Tax=Flavobacterium sp. TaxID=239 RepID=UPI0012232CF2|nr:antibiotic biosynthesis monooxygenase [Flavobacterium sp.]RZJ65437.1 MAG: antibiotic biosynthesis monooxygenase [Flavobacterium sp.]
MYAVIFTSTKTANDDGYDEMSIRMIELAKQQPGFIAIESARSELGITVSYWEDLDAIKNWKQNSEHLFAQQTGRKKWYKNYSVRIAKVEREYSFGEFGN